MSPTLLLLLGALATVAAMGITFEWAHKAGAFDTPTKEDPKTEPQPAPTATTVAPELSPDSSPDWW